jgi:hypothetical protein
MDIILHIILRCSQQGHQHSTELSSYKIKNATKINNFESLSILMQLLLWSFLVKQEIIWLCILLLCRLCATSLTASVVKWSEFLARSRVRFPALPDFLSSSGSGTWSTQPREDNWGATWTKKVAAPVKRAELTARGIRCADHATPPIRKKLALTSPTSGGRSVGIDLWICSQKLWPLDHRGGHTLYNTLLFILLVNTVFMRKRAVMSVSEKTEVCA